MNSILDDGFDILVRFLTGTSPYSAELQSFWMAIQGSVAIRNGINKDRHMHWFHSFVLSVVAGYGGGLLGFIWMGKPSAMLSNDLNIAGCILAWTIINCMPYDIGHKICNTVPVILITTSFAQLFRCMGIVKFIKVCFDEFKSNPSAYYPIPVFGPILYATLLGNMSGFVMKGLEGHVSGGIPWPFQNGLFCASFYHFFVNDKTGPVGNVLRRISLPVSAFVNLDDATFAACVISVFMQVIGFLQLPFVLGPSFTPFATPAMSVSSPFEQPLNAHQNSSPIKPTSQEKNKLPTVQVSSNGTNAHIGAINVQDTTNATKKKKKQKKKKQS